ncbi:MAG: ethylbenzene dehydrogenase-related protein [Vicinamibacterales bacterium]
MRRALLVGAMIVLGAAAGCARAPAPTPDVVAVMAQALPDDPGDAAWAAAPEHVERLLLQDLVEPRLTTASTPEVRVRAIATPREIAFRLEWDDASRDDLPGNGRFVDGCAVQVPAVAEPSVPDPQMGQAGKGVQIVYWRADWQATVDGRGPGIEALYPNATVDHYPFEAPSLEAGSDAQRQMAARYAPADAVGNRRGGPRTTAVEELVAEGPGSIAPAGTSGARGKGVRTPTGWSVVVVRPLPGGLTPSSPGAVALAVWEGSAKEAGARKMRSGWVTLSMRGTS